MKPITPRRPFVPAAIAVAAWAAVSSGALADDYDAPAGYYAGATGSGLTLKNQLHDIIDGHRIVSYDSARQALAITDRDPNQPGNILLAYDRQSVSGNWDSGVTWNREHCWPKSRHDAYTTSGPDYSDLHMLRPCDPGLNGTRGNLNYGYGGSIEPTAPGSYGSYFYPGRADRGDMARMAFYASIRYDGSDYRTADMEVVAGNPGLYPEGRLGDLARLLEWHYADTPDDFERRRNQVVYENHNGENPYYWQGNRSPMVDHPEWAWSIFGGGSNDSQLSVAAPAADGSSSRTLDLGRNMLGQSAALDGQVSLSKGGSDPTYFSVTASGDAVSSVTGRFNAFTSGTGSRLLTLGLDAGVLGSTGLKTGTVTVDNLDITSSGTGRGSADGDDVVTIQAAVLAQRQVAPVSNVAVGPVLVGTDLSVTGAGATLTTSGSDHERTRVDVALTGNPDAHGIGLTGGTGQRFDDAADTGLRTLGGSFASAGAKSGQLALMVTTAENGGAGLYGEGSYLPAVVEYTATAIDHAEASLAAGADEDTASVAFGWWFAGSGPKQSALAVYNLQATAGYTADLDLDAVTGAGDSGVLSCDLAAGGTIAPGDAAGFSVGFDTATVGDYAATWTIANSDEDLPGAATGTDLTLALTGEVRIRGDYFHDDLLDANDIDELFALIDAAAPAERYDITGDGLLTVADADELVFGVFETAYGDTDLDGDVDLVDFGRLATHYQSAGAFGWNDGDLDGDGDVDLVDFGRLATSWEYGTAPAAAKIPEPATLVMGLLALPAAVGASGRRRR